MSLDQVLNAESVAVVGASKIETKRGFQAIKTLLEGKFEGKIFPVNPKEKRILGLSCYATLLDIPEPVDIVLITTPARTVPDILEACGQKEVAGAVIIAGGFGETGSEGIDLEEEILQKARKYNVRLIGPNTSGVMNLKTHMNLVGLRGARSGDIALVSQSGNMALSLITEAKIKSLKGFSYYVGVGNEADIRFHEYLEFFGRDQNTRAVLMYVEGMRQGREFLQQAYKTTLHTPVVLLKSGRSLTGRQSAGSHTGALAGMSEVANTAFKRAGIIVIENSDELFPAVESLSSLPPIRNNNVAILADGGGHATIAADLLTDFGLGIPELGEKSQERLRKILPGAASVRNPVDVAGGMDADPTVLAECARIILKDANVGGLLVAGLFGGYGIRFAETLSLQEEDTAHQIGKIVKTRKKPIVFHSLYTSERPHSLHLLRYYDIPVYDSLDIACKSISVLAEYGNYLSSYHAKTNFVLNPKAKRKAQGEELIRQARAEGHNVLLEVEGKQLLALHGAPRNKNSKLRGNGQASRDCRLSQEDYCKSFLAKTEDEAVSIAKDIRGPVAMKIVSPQILHKSDAKGVRLNIRNETDVRGAFSSIMSHAKRYNANAQIKGVAISAMANPGLEVIIGTKTDDQFGPVIMYGLGGVMVEILKDVSFRVLPISRRSAKHMMEETKSYPILNGVRGQVPYDIKALEDLLLICSEVVESYPEIKEMDLNPVIVHEQGLSIVDVRILLHETP